MYKGLSETHADETLSDNTKINYCKQCRKCAFWGNGDAFTNKYDKSCCDQYPYPIGKPDYVINNTGSCDLFVERE